MAEADLLESILDNGIRRTNFFDGRVLTADDLRTEQLANAQEHGRLGLAVGAGVVAGFEVRLAAVTTPGAEGTVVRVTRGLAINADGGLVALGADTDVALVQSEEPPPSGLFTVCKPPTTELTNPGLYVLTVLPAGGFQGRAPMTELGSNGVGTSCGARFEVQGAQFRLVSLMEGASASDPGLRGQVVALSADVNAKVTQAASLVGAPTALAQKEAEIVRAVSRLRSAAAYLCFGADSFTDFSNSPFPRSDGRVPAVEYGALDDLRRRSKLKTCEVPLALLYWSSRGIEAIDWWAVRRPVHPEPVSPLWPLLDRRRRRAEALAMLLQFQQQIEDLRASNAIQGNLGTIKAVDWFSWLPPCGFLPVPGSGSTAAFSIANFFQGLTPGAAATTVDGKKIEAMVEEALDHPPLRASSGFVQLYETEAPTVTSPPQPYVLFTTRATHGVLEDDAVSQTFQSAWSVYGAIVQRRIFLPMAATPNAEAARISIIAAVQDVRAIALQKATLAASRRLGVRDALGAFKELADRQNDLVTLFQTGLPGVADVNNRSQFAGELADRLNASSGGLVPSINSASLLKTIAAQGAINAFVGGWSGGVALGDILVTYTGQSPQGLVLVLNSTSVFVHRFVLRNSTDQALNIDLAASLDAPGHWTGNLPAGNSFGGALEIQSPEGTVAPATLSLQSGGTRNFTVAIRVPSDAAAGPATLKIDAHVGQPHNKDFHFEKPLTVGDAQGQPTSRSVEFTAAGVPDDGDVAPGLLEYAFKAVYANATSALAAPFQLSVEITEQTAAANEWAADIVNRAVTAPTTGATFRIATRDPINMTPGPTGTLFNVQLLAPARAALGGSAKTALVTVIVKSIDTLTAIDDHLTWKLTVNPVKP